MALALLLGLRYTSLDMSYCILALLDLYLNGIIHYLTVMMEKEAKRHMPSGVVKKIRFVKDPNGPSKKYLLFSCKYHYFNSNMLELI